MMIPYFIQNFQIQGDSFIYHTINKYLLHAGNMWNIAVAQ